MFGRMMNLKIDFLMNARMTKPSFVLSLTPPLSIRDMDREKCWYWLFANDKQVIDMYVKMTNVIKSNTFKGAWSPKEDEFEKIEFSPLFSMDDDDEYEDIMKILNKYVRN